jgi:hypothetical protein
MRSASLDSLVLGLKGFGRVRRRLRLASGLCAWLLLTLAILAGYVICDVLLSPGAIPLLVLFGLSSLSVFVLLVILVARPLLSRVNPEREALVAESLVGSLRNRMITALQMGDRVGATLIPGVSMNVSPRLVAAVEEQAAEDLRRHQPAGRLDRKNVRRRAVAALIVSLLAAGMAVWRPDVLSERSRRLRQACLAVADRLWPVVAHVSPGNTTVLRGSRVVLGLDLQGRQFAHAVLRRIPVEKEGSKEFPPERLELAQGAARFTSEELQESFDYWFQYGEKRTPTHRIRVVDEPAIERIRVDLDYPPYTKRLPRTFMGRVPIIRALEGTRVTVSITYNKDIANAEAIWESGIKEFWDTAGRYVGTEFIVSSTDTVDVRAQCVDGYSVRQPLRFSILAEKDERPEIAAHVKSPQEGNIMLTAEQLPLFSVGFTATDDFGVSSVELVYEKGGTDVDLASEAVKGSIPMAFQPARDKVVDVFKKCFASLSVQPGDTVVFYLEAKDNRDGTPNIGRTARKYSIVIYQPRLTAFLDEKMAAWGEGLRLWGPGVERAGKVASVTMPPVARRVSQSPATELQDFRSAVFTERVPGANRQAEAQFRELMARWKEKTGREE